MSCTLPSQQRSLFIWSSAQSVSWSPGWWTTAPLTNKLGSVLYYCVNTKTRDTHSEVETCSVSCISNRCLIFCHHVFKQFLKPQNSDSYLNVWRFKLMYLPSYETAWHEEMKAHRHRTYIQLFIYTYTCTHLFECVSGWMFPVAAGWGCFLPLC